MRWLLVCATAAAFVVPRVVVPRGAPLAGKTRALQPLPTARGVTRVAPLAGKTRALQETNTNTPWHDKGDDFRKLLKEFREKVTKYILVAAARIKLYYLKARAFARTDKGRKVCGLAAILLFAVLTRKARAASALRRAELLAVEEVPWSQFLRSIERKGMVSEVLVSSSRYDFLMNGARKYTVPAEVPGALASKMLRSGVTWRRARPRASPASAVVWLIAIGYLTALGRVARQMTGGGIGNVGRRRKQVPSVDNEVTFDSVAGIDAAKREVAELVALSSQESAKRYLAVGARPPRGVLLVGPPGTGKTLLARALAQAAERPFISCSGSEFVEMFVGRGAARVRQLFERAGKIAPCVVFIDEIDALGRRRRESNFAVGNANDELEQTLNQLLACMDGVDPNQGVVVLAATNRLNVLDPALVRPGRFDRVVKVPPPDLVGREQILRVHARKVALGSDVDLSSLAKETRGLVGADLAAIVNEAAIRAARRGAALIGKNDVKNALQEYYESRSTLNSEQFGPFSFAAPKEQPSN